MRARSWLILCALHGVASMLAWWSQGVSLPWLAWNADDWLLRPWTLWTSAWVHSNTPHLIANQMALGLLVALAWLVRPDGWSTLAWALAWPLTQALLPMWPQIGHAVGLSGLLHAAAGVLAVHLMLGRLPLFAGRRWGVLLGLVLLAKLLLERAWDYPVVWDAATERSVVQAAALTGTFWGVALGLLSAWAAWDFRRRWVSP